MCCIPLSLHSEISTIAVLNPAGNRFTIYQLSKFHFFFHSLTIFHNFNFFKPSPRLTICPADIIRKVLNPKHTNEAVFINGPVHPIDGGIAALLK